MPYCTMQAILDHLEVFIVYTNMSMYMHLTFPKGTGNTVLNSKHYSTWSERAL